MSFSKIQKSVVAAQADKNVCCRRAFLCGMLAAKAYIVDGAVEISLDGEDVLLCFSKLCEEIYGKKPNINSSKKGGRRKIASITSNSALKYIANLNNTSNSNMIYKQKCHGCVAAFWRGVFIACGRVSDPEVQYNLEFSLGNRAELFMELFEKIGFSARFVSRKTEKIIYFKNGSALEEFFALAGMNSTVFSIINARINNESRTNANRIANCETNNIGKSVNASLKHILAVKDLEKAGLLSSLPEELERTARLRILHTDLSLSQLANISVPAITKSGLSHRLNKLLEIAEQKLHKKYS